LKKYSTAPAPRTAPANTVPAKNFNAVEAEFFDGMAWDWARNIGQKW
jgi:hypothetical protein